MWGVEARKKGVKRGFNQKWRGVNQPKAQIGGGKGGFLGAFRSFFSHQKRGLLR